MVWCESAGKPVHPQYCSSPRERTMMGSSMVPMLLVTGKLVPEVVIPRRDESRGFMSKISMPSCLPRISSRSRPVACSRSVGTVPGWAPGPTSVSGPLTSVAGVNASVSNVIENGADDYHQRCVASGFLPWIHGRRTSSWKRSLVVIPLHFGSVGRLQSRAPTVFFTYSAVSRS